jgi:hypothetical protein
MNKRILELADKAVEDMPSGPWNIPDEFCKKFAELIVQKCVDIVSKVPNGYRDYRNQIEDAMRADCLQAIQEHFGVEE